MTDRRGFLFGAAAAAAGAAVSGCATEADAASGGGRILYGACRGPEDVKLLREVGYDFWEWNAGAAFDPSKDDAWWKGQLDLIRSQPLPLRSCNGFIPGRFRLTGPAADHGPALDYAETVLRRAEQAGVRCIVFGSGGARNVPGDFCTAAGGLYPDLEKGVAQYAGFCSALCARVKDLRTVTVVIEPLRPRESNIVNYVWQAKQIAEDVGSPRLKVLADIFHMMMGREDASSILRAGPLLRHCHIADYGTRSFPGADPSVTARLRPYFEMLTLARYEGGVSCECGWGKNEDLRKNLATALATMRRLEAESAARQS